MQLTTDLYNLKHGVFISYQKFEPYAKYEQEYPKCCTETKNPRPKSWDLPHSLVA